MADPSRVDPARCWLHAEVASSVEAYDRCYEQDGQRSPRSRRPRGSEPPMGKLVPSPEAMPGTASKQRVIQVGVGGEHGILLTDAGIAFTWGDNRYGQLGRIPCLKEEDKRPFPVMALAGEEVTQVAAGVHHCLALAAPGLAWAWGRNKVGQLGCGNNRDKVAPERVIHPTRKEQLGTGKEHHIISIGAGGSSSVASSISSEIWQWGEISERFKEQTDTTGMGGRGGASGGGAERSVTKNRPFLVFKKEKFLSHLRKATSGNKKMEKTHVSITETGCRVLGPDAHEDSVKDLVESVRQLQEAIAAERAELAQAEERRQREETNGKGADSDLSVLHDLQMSIAMLERDIVVVDRDVDMLQKNLQSTELRLEHTRQQLNTVMQQATQLNETQDEVALKMFDAKKGTSERKRLQERLEEIKKFVDANQSTRESLLEQKTETDKEKQRTKNLLGEKKTSQEKLKKKLKTLKDLSSAVSSASGASDSLIKFLQEKSDNFMQHFQGRAVETDFLAAMQEFENDSNFLRGIETRVRDLAATASCDKAGELRTRLICDLLQDLVSLRRSWNDLLEDRWLKDDLDLSCFFNEASSGQLALQAGGKDGAL